MNPTKKEGSFVYNSDEPIKKKADDILERREFAITLAENLQRWHGDNCLTIAINGEWGSGKSSIKNMVKESLLENAYQPEEIIEFNPWEWSKQDKIPEELFREIGFALDQGDFGKENKKLKIKWLRWSKRIGLVKSVFAGADKIINSVIAIGALISGISYFKYIEISEAVGIYVLIAGFLLKILFHLLNNFENFYQYLSDLKSLSIKPAADLKDDLKGLFKKLDKNIIIIVDDIDRLSEQQIQTVFQLVKANADFPNIVYLLLFDKQIVELALEDIAPKKGAEFLEKIVQVNFNIPLVDDNKLSEILETKLNDISKELTHSEIVSNKRWKKIYNGGVDQYFNNIRQINRFINSFSFHSQLFKSEKSYEVNIIDLIGIEAIRMFEPNFYSVLHESKNVLLPLSNDFTDILGIDEIDFHRYVDDIKEKNIIDDLISQNQAKVKNSSALKEVMKELFPHNNGNSQSLLSYLNAKRVQHPELFRLYFSLNIPADFFSLSDYKTLLDKFSGKTEEDSNILEGTDTPHIKRILHRIESNLELINIFTHEKLITELVDLGEDNSLENKNERFLHLKVLDILVDLVLIQKDVQKCEQVINILLDQKKSTYIPVKVIDEVIQVFSNKKHSLNQELQKNDTRLNDSILELKKKGIKKIEDSANAELLEDADWYMLYLLKIWYNWSKDESSIKEWVQNLTKSDEGFLKFLTGTLKKDQDKKRDEELGEFYGHHEVSFIKEIADIDELEAKARKLFESSDDVNEEKKKILVPFIYSYKHFQK